MVKRSGKGDYCRKAQNHPEECLLEGRKFAFRVGAEILALGTEFPALRNSAKSFTKHCGATFCKGAGNSGLAKFPGARNSIISGP
jgi:hypothetical protein